MRWSDPYTQQHSPLLFGVGGLFLYVGIGFLVYLGLALPTWIWGSGLVILGVGFGLEIVTRRFTHVRIYQIFVACTLALTFGMVLWTVASNGRRWETRLLVAVIIAVSLAATAIGGYRNNLARRIGISANPVGPYGDFDPRTGMVTRDTSLQRRQEQERTERGYAWLRWAGPLIAGLSMAIASSLRGSALDLVIAMVALVTAYGSAAGAGAIWFYFRAARCWEREHGKRIYVKR